MKNKLQLHLAALTTAQKTLGKTERETARIIGDDFDELKIDDRHFVEFNKMVGDAAYQFAALEKVLLDPPAPVAPAS